MKCLIAVGSAFLWRHGRYSNQLNFLEWLIDELGASHGQQAPDVKHPDGNHPGAGIEQVGQGRKQKEHHDQEAEDDFPSQTGCISFDTGGSLDLMSQAGKPVDAIPNQKPPGIRVLSVEEKLGLVH